MRKLYIFFIAFWVSFMTIYSIYYYKVKNKLDQSVVAMAKDLPHTVFGFEAVNDSDKNMIFTEGLTQVIPSSSKGYDSLVSPVPDADFVSFNGTYTKQHLEKFYEGLVTKFQNHPPLEFKNLKDSAKLLLSYFFENVRLPDGFRVSASPVDFHGKKVRALQYHHQYTSDTGYVSFYKNDQDQEYVLKVKINDGKEELIMSSCQGCGSWQIAKAKSDSLIKSTPRYYITNKESVLVPELDFNIAKDLDKNAIPTNPDYSGYSLTEERIKFKISPPKEGGPIEANKAYNTPGNFVMKGNVLVYIREVGKKTPYCLIYIKHPEILKPAAK